MAHPGPPSDPQFSNVGPTSLTISWSPSVDDNGTYPNFQYLVQEYIGSAFPTGPPVKQYNVTGTTVNITNLKSGQEYQFFLWTDRNDNTSDRLSTQVGPIFETTLAASWIRHNGVWVSAVPYVRVGGIWKMANPYVRQAGIWQPTL